MFNEIKNKIDLTLARYAGRIDKIYTLKKISPVLSHYIKEYICRQGKRVRSTLFVVSYQGYARNPKPGLYSSALALELLHNFMLIHDDIIDRSELRRGKPAMHTMLDRHLAGYRNLKFNGSDLGIVIADVIYAMSIDAFLEINENPRHKEAALKKFAEAAIFTGSGEFIEMLAGAKPIDEITIKEIYKIYDLKTAYYTFCSPLTIGALLAGAAPDQISKLIEYGINVGRAFQINDDILDMFATEIQTGKSALTDIKESKKTLLIWQAFQKTSSSNRETMQRIFDKSRISRLDLEKIRSIVQSSGSLAFAREQIKILVSRALKAAAGLTMKKRYKKLLFAYPPHILRI
ncbi:MAG: polyprenyl synthetase family protein [Candidatus Omnitrophota bacterium]